MNPHTLSLKQVLLPLLLGGSLILTGCNKANESAEQDTLSSDDKILHNSALNRSKVLLKQPMTHRILRSWSTMTSALVA